MTIQDYVNSIQGKSYTWGEVDCVTTAMTAVNIYYNKEVFEDVERWNTKKQALKEYAKHGSLYNYFDHGKWEEVQPNYMQTADILVMDTKPMQTACVIVNNRILVISPDGDMGVKLITREGINVSYKIYRLRRG